MTPLLRTAALCSLLAATTAAARTSSDEEDFAGHFQLGFVAGRRDLSQAGFVFGSGAGGELPFGQSLTEPFAAAPFSGVAVTGLAVEWGWTQHHVRLSLGVTKPFASFRLIDARTENTEGGVTQAVGVRSLSLWDLRFALGTAFDFGRFSPSLDLVGTSQRISADLTVEGRAVSYAAWTFGLAARGGVRVRVDDFMYVVASGELGLAGGSRWAADLAVGWSLH